MWNGKLWLGYTIGTSADKMVFMILKARSICGVQRRDFLPDLSERGLSKWARLGHMSQYVLMAPRKRRISLREHGGSCSRMAEMRFFHGLRPMGVNQYPSQLVSWKAHSHLRGLIVNPFALRQDNTLSIVTRCPYQVLEKIPISRR